MLDCFVLLKFDYLITKRSNKHFVNNGTILFYKFQSVCVCVCEYVSKFVRNRLKNHAYYGDEAFAGDSVGIGLGQRLDFIFRKGNFGAKSR